MQKIYFQPFPTLNFLVSLSLYNLIMKCVTNYSWSHIWSSKFILPAGSKTNRKVIEDGVEKHFFKFQKHWVKDLTACGDLAKANMVNNDLKGGKIKSCPFSFSPQYSWLSLSKDNDIIFLKIYHLLPIQNKTIFLLKRQFSDLWAYHSNCIIQS